MNIETARNVEREPHGSSDGHESLDFSANTNPETPGKVAELYRSALEESRRYRAEPPSNYREAAAAYVECAPEQVIPMPGGLVAIRRPIGLAVDDVLGSPDQQKVTLWDATTFRGLGNHARVAVHTPAGNDRLLEVLHDV